MSDDAVTAVRRLAAGGRWPDADLVDAVARAGGEALEALRELVRDDLRRRPEEVALPNVLGLLADALAELAQGQHEEVAGELAGLYRRYDDDTLESVTAAVVRLGAPALPVLEKIARDRAVRWYGRTMAAAASVRIARPDAEGRARVGRLLRDLLAEPGRSGEVTDAERSLAAAAAWGLAVLPDRKAADLIDSAFARRLIVEPEVSREAIARAYEKPRGERPRGESFASAYRRRWQDRRMDAEWLEAERRRSAERSPGNREGA